LSLNVLFVHLNRFSVRCILVSCCEWRKYDHLCVTSVYFTCRKKNLKFFTCLIIFIHLLTEIPLQCFLDLESGSQKATLVVVVISSVKIPKAFLIRNGVQQNFACTFMLTFPTDLPSQILKLFSN